MVIVLLVSQDRVLHYNLSWLHAQYRVQADLEPMSLSFRGFPSAGITDVEHPYTRHLPLGES